MFMMILMMLTATMKMLVDVMMMVSTGSLSMVVVMIVVGELDDGDFMSQLLHHTKAELLVGSAKGLANFEMVKKISGAKYIRVIKKISETLNRALFHTCVVDPKC
jgi:hypothetical protein